MEIEAPLPGSGGLARTAELLPGDPYSDVASMFFDFRISDVVPAHRVLFDAMIKPSVSNPVLMLFVEYIRPGNFYNYNLEFGGFHQITTRMPDRIDTLHNKHERIPFFLGQT